MNYMTRRRMERFIALSVTFILMSSRMANAWNVTINGRPTSDLDAPARSVAVDPQTGAIFVVGRLENSSNTTEFVIRKLTSDGQTQWQEVLHGTADAGVSAGAATVVIDKGGFVFVAGTVGNTNTASDIVIMKIDGRSPSMDVLWTRIIDVFNFDDQVNAIALTPDGGVAVAGLATTAGGGQDLYVMKFASDGTDAWPAPQTIAGTASNGTNVATAVGTLPNGDIAVTGWVTNVGTNVDFVVGRFDGTTGARNWLVALNDPQVNGTDVGTTLGVAANGDIVAGGITSHPFTNSDFSVFRFNGAGALLWQSIINLGFFDAVRTVAVAPNGNIIAGGTLELASGPDNSELFVVNLDANGQERWRYQEAGKNFFLEARAIAFDANGNPVVTGMTEDSAEALSTFTLLAFNNDTGMVRWNVSIVGTAPFENEGDALASDPIAGTMIAVGLTQNNRTSFDITVTSISDGSENWRRTMNGHGKRQSRDDSVLAMAVDPLRNSIALSGYAQDNGAGLLGTPHEFRIVKIRKNGVIAWKYDLRDSAPHLDNEALAVAIARGGDFFATGRTCTAPGRSCFTVVHLSKTGKEIWRTVLPGSGEGRAIVVDPDDGNIIVAGTSNTPAPGSFAVLKLDANTGAVLWSPSADDALLGSALALTLTSRGTVAVAGVLSGSFAVVELDATTGSVLSRGSLPASGVARAVAFDGQDGTVVAVGSVNLIPFGTAMAVAKFDGTGSPVWSESFGTSGNPSAASVTVDENTEAIVLGGTLTDPTGPLLMVIALGPDGVEQWRTAGIIGNATSVAVAANVVFVAGQLRDGSATDFGLVALAEADGSEQWRRTFRGSANFGQNSAAAVAVDLKKNAVFAAGVVVNTNTGPDMFAVGLGTDGSDLVGVPGVRSFATPSTQQAFMEISHSTSTSAGARR